MEKTTIKLEIPVEIAMLCDIFDITPQHLLTNFMEDLCSMKSNQGSDERQMAKDYFLRGGIATLSWSDNYELPVNLIEGFTEMHMENYPAISNTEYDEKRIQQLKEWHSRAMKIKKRTIKKVN